MAKTLIPNPTILHLDKAIPQGDTITLVASSKRTTVACPDCGKAAQRLHSRYQRTVADLPWQGIAVWFLLSVRKFFCDNRECNRRIFAESFPEVVNRYARKTVRLADALMELAFLVGGEAAARIARTFGLLVSPDALLNIVRRASLPAPPTPRVLGIDDFAFKKGHIYGTILIDLERRCPVDLWPDRSADSVAKWLKQHPGIEIISRDRAGVYADGATRGASDAVQVADRFHLLHNIVEAIERFLGRQRQHLREAAKSAAMDLKREDTSEATPPPQPPMTKSQCQRTERREQRLAGYHRVAELQDQGVSIRAIAESLGMSRRTVRRILRADALSDALPDYGAGSFHSNQCDSFAPYLRQRWDEGCHNASQLFREIKERGFCGCQSALRVYLGRWRLRPPPELGRQRGQLPNRASTGGTPSPRATTWLLLGARTKKNAEASSEQSEERLSFSAAFLEQLCLRCDQVKTAQTLGREFFRLVREHCGEGLDDWITSAQASSIAELQGFASSLLTDKAAVVASLSSAWSNGQVEGQVNRLKFLKRSMYGRAGFDLLRARVLHRVAA